MAPGETLTESDNGKTVEARVGQTILLRLPGNPTTGYRWALDGGGSGVQMEEGDHRPWSNAPGSGGETSWSITPTAQGTAEVKLKLWRQWEGDASIRKRFTVKLSVNG